MFWQYTRSSTWAKAERSNTTWKQNGASDVSISVIRFREWLQRPLPSHPPTFRPFKRLCVIFYQQLPTFSSSHPGIGGARQKMGRVVWGGEREMEAIEAAGSAKLTKHGDMLIRMRSSNRYHPIRPIQIASLGKSAPSPPFPQQREWQGQGVCAIGSSQLLEKYFVRFIPPPLSYPPRADHQHPTDRRNYLTGSELQVCENTLRGCNFSERQSQNTEKKSLCVCVVIVDKVIFNFTCEVWKNTDPVGICMFVFTRR